jgi:very-short-patch-repair endonuclease
LNIETIRLSNEEVLDNLKKVKDKIISVIQERKASLSREVAIPQLRERRRV